MGADSQTNDAPRFGQCTAKSPIKAETPGELPPGNWTLSAMPSWREDHRTAPLFVASVTMNAGKGLTIESVTLKNRSSKAVEAVRLKWEVATRDDLDSVLLQGETPWIQIPQGIPPGGQGSGRLSCGLVRRYLRICLWVSL